MIIVTIIIIIRFDTIQVRNNSHVALASAHFDAFVCFIYVDMGVPKVSGLAHATPSPPRHHHHHHHHHTRPTSPLPAMALGFNPRPVTGDNLVGRGEEIVMGCVELDREMGKVDTACAFTSLPGTTHSCNNWFDNTDTTHASITQPQAHTHTLADMHTNLHTPPPPPHTHTRPHTLLGCAWWFFCQEGSTSWRETAFI
jgi:hypothetical protein